VRLRRLYIAIFVVAVLLYAGVCGEKNSGSPEDLLFRELIGKWTSTKRSEEEGVKVVETFTLLFQQQDDETSYRWTYSVTYDSIEDESQKKEEDGTFTVTETEITFIPDNGETRTLVYVMLKDDPLYDLRIIEENGVEWNMVYFAWFGHKP
jgi:hypothetical protein